MCIDYTCLLSYNAQMLQARELSVKHASAHELQVSREFATTAVLSQLADLPIEEALSPNPPDLIDLASKKLTRYANNAGHIGLDLNEYIDLMVASIVGDQATIANVISKSEQRMHRDNVIESVFETSAKELYEKHMSIVKMLLKGVKKSRHQKLTILAGPYAAGKTEVFENRFNTYKDQVSIDLDKIRELLMVGYDPTSQEDIQKVRVESWMVSDLLLKTALKHKYSCIIQTSLHRKSRWIDDPSVRYAKKNGIPIEVHMLLRPVTDCLDRNMNRDRSAAIRDLMDSMHGAATLIDFVKKFGKGVRVHLIDYYPLIEREQHILPVAFRDEYLSLLSYALRRKDVFVDYYVEEDDLPVL